MSLAQGNNTPTRPRIEPGSPDPDPESDALTTRPVRPKIQSNRFYHGILPGGIANSEDLIDWNRMRVNINAFK